MTDVRRQDRKAALKRHGSDCLKCGSDVRVEVHHVYGTADRNPDHHRPLCYYCHLVAPMEDAYWEWEKTGPDGWAGFINALAPKLAESTPQMREELAALPLSERQATKQRKDRSSIGAHPEAIAIFTMELRYAGLSIAEIAAKFNRLGVDQRSSWTAAEVERNLADFCEANCAVS